MSGQHIVVKCGGNAAVAPDEICHDVARLRRDGWRVTLVHGGSADIEHVGAQVGLRSRSLTSPSGYSTRYTDPETMGTVTMALCGVSKPRLLTKLAALGVPALGLTGLDATLIRGRRKEALRTVVDGRVVIVRDDQSGRITEVNGALLDSFHALGLVPVLSPPVLDEDHRPINTDADRTAAAVGVATNADVLVMLTGAPGLLAVPDDESSLLTQVELPTDAAEARGGMALKLIAAEEAGRGGIETVIIADGRGARPVLSALEGSGTRCRLTDATTVRVAG